MVQNHTLNAHNWTISLTDLTLPCRIGVSDEERSQITEVVAHIEIEADLQRAAHSDNLLDTIDYAHIASLVRKIALNCEYKLLETLIHCILTHIHQKLPNIKAIRCKIDKPHAISGAVASVSCIWEYENLGTKSASE